MTIPTPTPSQLSALPPLQVAITGTDTGVGKSHVTACLLQGLRARGRRVWVHKPIACGGWEHDQAEDARFLQRFRADDQPSASLCPLQFPEAASPHLAAAAAHKTVTMEMLMAGVALCQSTSVHAHDVVVEGAGGLLVPVTTAREMVADLLFHIKMPVLIVTRPHLGTLNHTALTVRVAQQYGLSILGLVLNYHSDVDDSLAVRSAIDELPAVTGVPVIATLRYRPHTYDPSEADQLAAAVLAATLAAAARGAHVVRATASPVEPAHGEPGTTSQR